MTAAEKLTWGHVLELRAAVAAGGGFTRDDISTRGEASAALVRDLEAAKLMTWDGGARAVPGTRKEYGTWETRQPGTVAVTVAGLACLHFYDLGLQRKGADAMARAIRAMPKPLRLWPTIFQTLTPTHRQ